MPPARAATVNDVGIQSWIDTLPIVTKYWLGATTFLTVLANFGIFSPYKLIFEWSLIKDRFEVWRFLTPFCYAGPFKIDMVFLLYMLYAFSRQYEAGGPYNTGAGGGTADYVFMLMFGAASILATYHLPGPPMEPIFTRNLVFHVLYVWSKRNPTAPANIWGVPLKGAMMPFAYLFLTVAMGNPFFDMLHGIVIGHIYYFLVDVLPNVHDKNLLNTPEYLIDVFGIGEYHPEVAALPRPQQQANRGGIGAPPGRVNAPNNPAAAAPARGGHQWGSGGQRLGD